MKEERHQKILDILANGQYVSVEALSRELYVSMPTIRRDLSAMQEMGLVIRSHGGVVRRSESDAFPLSFRTEVNAGEKQRLSKAASELLFDDCVIFVDESSTTLHITDHLTCYKNIKVITNSMSVLHRLYKMKVKAYCLGGEFSRDTTSFYGRDTEDMLSRFSIDLMFFSSSGLDKRGWIVDYCEEANSLRRRVLEQAERKVFLCDKSKFGKRGAYALMPVREADYVVLNAPLPDGIDTGSAHVIVV